jgi:hypothetical protein
VEEEERLCRVSVRTATTKDDADVQLVRRLLLSSSKHPPKKSKLLPMESTLFPRKSKLLPLEDGLKT